MYELGANRYGKSRIRLVTVTREAERHVLRDLTVDVALEGDFTAAHVDGDNTNLVATDTMKNTVYAFARDRLTGAPEAFGLELARHFAAGPQVGRASITLREHGWDRVALAGGPAPDAFARRGDLTRVAVVAATKSGATVEAGIEDLTVMKTTKSAFSGFERDRYTTLAETDDRLMATKVTALWGYGETAAEPGFDFDAAWETARSTLLAVFGEHFSPSVQTSIWIMATAMLDASPAIDWVRMVLPNLHHWTVNLEPFGLDNPGKVFVSTTEPHGLIDATVRRTG
ncbi:MAG: urate oxidase [Chloroflexi bacterium]|nr:urate oxidase [Chloroflexota bacterium]